MFFSVFVNFVAVLSSNSSSIKSQTEFRCLYANRTATMLLHNTHNSIERIEILQYMAFSVSVNIKGLPELTSYDYPKQHHKMDWANFTENELQQYKALTDVYLNSIEIPVNAVSCGNIHCKDGSHFNDLCKMFDTIVNCLVIASNGKE